MDNRVYWIWLQNAFGAGSPKPVQLVRRMGSAEKLYQGGTRLWSSFSFVSDKELAALNAYGAEQAAAALEYYLKLGQKVITPDDEDYPVLLKEIYNPPAVLYVQGDLSILSDAVSISIVGTRKASQNGLNAARELAYGLALKNAVDEAGPDDGEIMTLIDRRRNEFVDAMEDDLNTADAIGVIVELVRDINTNVHEGVQSRSIVEYAAEALDELTGVLGLLYNRKAEESLDEEVERLIEERNAARKAKNWAEADRIRDDLKARGIVLEDTAQGVKWHKA